MRWLGMTFPLCLTGYLKPNCMTSKKKMKGDNLDKTTLKYSSTYATSNLHAINVVPAKGYFMDFQELNTAVAGEISDVVRYWICLLYTSPSPRDKRQSRMPSSA